MSFERHISEEEILQTREKGIAKARQYLTEEDINSRFLRVMTCAEKISDNFHPDKYFSRGNDKKPVYSMKILLLAAFEAVETMRVLEPEIYGEEHTYFSRSYELVLAQAMQVFKTNGVSHCPKKADFDSLPHPSLLVA